MIRTVVGPIRRHYRPEVPIVLRLDGSSTKLFACCEEVGIGYVCGGKILPDLAFFVDVWVTQTTCATRVSWCTAR